MAKQVIDIGTTAGDGTGDPGRTAFDKVNDNFTELYTADSDHLAASDPHSQYILVAGTRAFTGDQVTKSLEPLTTGGSSLGTVTKRYATSNTNQIKNVAGGVTLNNQASTSGGLISTFGVGAGTNNAVLTAGAYVPSAACVGTLYAYLSGGTTNLKATESGASVFGGVGAWGSTSTSTMEATSYGSHAIGYAYSGSSGVSTIKSEAKGSVAAGFTTSTAGSATIGASNSGSFAQGYVQSTKTGFANSISALANGSFCQGFVSVGAGTGANAMITTTDKGAFAQGNVTSSVGVTATISGVGAGSFAQGNCVTGLITATGIGAFAQGSTITGYSISATGAGSFAHGHTTSASIAASAVNATQFGMGTNNTADSLQVGGNVLLKANGQKRSKDAPITLGVGVTTFATTSDFMTITGDGGGNTIATITAGIEGQHLTLKFVDALVTITDTAAATANTVNLSAAFTSTANDIMMIVFDNNKWFEVSRSIN